MKYRKQTVAVFALALACSGCAPMVETRGNQLSDVRLAQIRPAVSTRAEVSQKWGPPTTVSAFDPNTWYYIGETTAQEGVFAPEVKSRRMVRVRFDENDMVTEVAEVDPAGGRDVDIVDRATPTAGRGYTVLQQFVGNLGRFNSSQGGAARE